MPNKRYIYLQFFLLFWLTCVVSSAAAASGGVHAGTGFMQSSPVPAGQLAPSTVYTASQPLPPGAVEVRNQETVSNDLDDYDSAPVAAIADPIEPWNRFWFRFNDIFYLYIAKPVYTGWTWITPQFLRNGIASLFHNVLFPTRFINSLLQFRFFEAGVEYARFMMSIMGSAGLVDLAKNKKTIVPVDPSGEDFGQTLGRWGFGQGFYIVWPFIGPSSLRDSFGRVGDWFTDPLVYVHPWPYPLAAGFTFRLNDVGEILPGYEDLKSIAVDPYIAMREAYAALREAQVRR